MWGDVVINSMDWILSPYIYISSVQFSSFGQSCPTLCDPVNRSTPGLPVHHQLPEFTQTHVHWVSDAIQQSHPLSSPSPPAPNPSQHQSLYQWVNSSHTHTHTHIHTHTHQIITFYTLNILQFYFSIILGWPKTSFRFVTSYRKTQREFLANSLTQYSWKINLQ